MRELQSVGDALQRLMRQLGLEHQFRTYDALAHWSDIVGKQVAQVARPLRLDADTLWIAVKSHAWAQELNFQKGTILKRLNERVGEERFKELRFTVRATLPAGVVPKAPEDADTQRLPEPTLSETELAEIESRLASVSEPVLRNALKRVQAASVLYQKRLAQLGWRRCAVCECYHSDESAVCYLCEQGV
ncbi:MAG: hypothetical protein KatS3mg017_0763 [Fimbriimonadales bacterium]|nr:MAG: hypothetical protein KatS3mg017_0763 [Fimbriimonadales bacterium]